MRRTALAGAFVALACLTTSCYYESHSIAEVRTGAFSNVPIAGIVGADTGHVGVDILMGSDYAPCGDNRSRHGGNDVAFGACAIPYWDTQKVHLSYYRVNHWNNSGTNADDPSDIQSGISVTNVDLCADPGRPQRSDDWCVPDQPLHHKWGNKVNRIRLEFYPHDDNAGGVHVDLQCCSHNANGVWYTSPEGVGTVQLPRAGEPGVGRFTGSVSGSGLHDRRVEISSFQTGDVRNVTSTGVPTGAFHDAFNDADNRWSSSPLWNGVYKIYILDNDRPSHRVVVYHTLQGDGQVLDFDVDAPCFGAAEAWDPNDDTHRFTPDECAALWSSTAVLSAESDPRQAADARARGAAATTRRQPRP